MRKEYYSNVTGLELVATCSDITEAKWWEYMNGTTTADGRKIERLIKKHLPELYGELALQYPNPYRYQSRKKDGLFVYVHSAIEYFIKVYRR